jgi:acyl transferase domain-containing protein
MMTDSSEETEVLSPTKRALLALKQMQAKLEALESAKYEPIAIIGMSCRFPGGADCPAAFWQLLHEGIDAIDRIPSDRWNIQDYYDSDPKAPGKMYVRDGGFVPHLKEFDAQFFRISPKEALSLDPQQRLLLEVSWEALENAAIAPEKLVGSQTGVFIGICGNDYWHHLVQRNPDTIDAYLTTGNTHSMASGRLSYIFGVNGPSISVDTACSSSLVAVHLAVTSLRNRECDLALAGGVNRLSLPEITINFAKAKMLSPDGRCKTFDAAANGFVRSEGCGAIVLKRLSDAITSDDNILAVICGSAVNQDGRTSGLTVPNGAAQQAVIRQALTNSKLEASQVNYIEAHGTGTLLGDPIELEALGAIFGGDSFLEKPLIVGSVKTNIGHLEAAAGIASLIKVVLALQHEEIPPHLHLHDPNPHVNWDKLSIEIPTKPIPWPRGERQRIAGISSFGFSGTNAHVVLAEAPLRRKKEKGKRQNKEEIDRPLHLLTLSAKNEKALKDLTERYRNFFRENPSIDIADVCFTANTGRSHFDCRLAVVASSTSELEQKLADVDRGEEILGLVRGRVKSTDRTKIVFLFGELDSEAIGATKELYETQITFRQAFNRCDEILQPFLEKSLRERLDRPSIKKDRSLIFALEYALFKLWQSWGIEPSAVMGWGAGECVAATVAGVFRLEDALKLIVEEIKPQKITYTTPQIPLISSVTGEFDLAEISTPSYWKEKKKRSIELTPNISQTLLKQRDRIFLVIDAQFNLSQLEIKLSLNLYLGQGNWQQVLQNLAQLYVLGIPIDWSSFDKDFARCKTILPTYPFQREKYWLV